MRFMPGLHKLSQEFRLYLIPPVVAFFSFHFFPLMNQKISPGEQNRHLLMRSFHPCEWFFLKWITGFMFLGCFYGKRLPKTISFRKTTPFFSSGKNFWNWLFSRKNHGKWKKHGKTMEKPWKNHGKITEQVHFPWIFLWTFSKIFFPKKHPKHGIFSMEKYCPSGKIFL